MSKPCFCTSLRKASRKLSSHYDEALAPLGINIGQFSLMRNVARREPVSLTELGHSLELDRSTVGRNTKVLERMGLLQQTTGEDSREALLVLSLEGRRVLNASEPLWHDVQARIEARLGDDADRLRQLLETL